MYTIFIEYWRSIELIEATVLTFYLSNPLACFRQVNLNRLKKVIRLNGEWTGIYSLDRPVQYL